MSSGLAGHEYKPNDNKRCSICWAPEGHWVHHTRNVTEQRLKREWRAGYKAGLDAAIRVAWTEIIPVDREAISAIRSLEIPDGPNCSNVELGADDVEQ